MASLLRKRQRAQGSITKLYEEKTFPIKLFGSRQTF